MAIAAEYYGVCQWCGSRQKLPGGVLAKHGYDVRFGFFNGVCRGSGNLPFEQSKEMIDESIKWAKHERANLMLKRALALAVDPASTNKTWCNVYHLELSSRARGAVYLWHFGEMVQVGESEFHHVFKYYDGLKSDRTKPGKLADKVREGYRSYAESLVKRISQLDEYIAYQQGRIKNWVPAELAPVEKAVA